MTKGLFLHLIVAALMLSLSSCDYTNSTNITDENAVSASNNKNLEGTKEVLSVVKEVINYKSLTHFLVSYFRKGTPVYFRFEQLPLYNGLALPSYISSPLPKPEFDIVVSNDYKAMLLTDYKGEWDKVTVLIESIVINNDSSTVRVRIPIEGVVGRFKLKKAGSWKITKAEVSEI